MGFLRRTPTIPTADEALPGRDTRPFALNGQHAVLNTSIFPPYPAGTEVAVFGLGCFWGAERNFWETPGVYTTAVGYAGGPTPNPTYDEVCSGRTGHTEVVQVVYDPAKVSFATLLKVFWEGHDPTQGMRQGNDVGTQYRSAIYVTTDEQLKTAEETKAVYSPMLEAAGFDPISTEIARLDSVGQFYFAEDYHQQYLHKVPNGYCGAGHTGVSCPVGVGIRQSSN